MSAVAAAFAVGLGFGFGVNFGARLGGAFGGRLSEPRLKSVAYQPLPLSLKTRRGHHFAE